MEYEYIVEALKKTQGNVTNAAKDLGMTEGCSDSAWRNTRSIIVCFMDKNPVARHHDAQRRARRVFPAKNVPTLGLAA